MSSYKNNRLAPSPKYLAKCPPMYAIHLKATQSPEEKSIFLKLEGDKTDDQKNREEMLLAQLMTLVKQRDQLVQIEDTQVQQRYVLLNLLKYLMVQIGCGYICYKQSSKTLYKLINRNSTSTP